MTWKTGIIILGVAMLLSFGGGFWCGWSVKKCAPTFVPVETLRIDTVYPNEPKTDTFYSKPQPKAQIRKSVLADNTASENTDHFEDSLEIVSYCIYSDTFSKENSYSAVINDTVSGEILGRSFKFTDLRPEIIRYETTTVNVPVEKKQPLVKVYGGAFGWGENPVQWGLGAAASAIIKDSYLLGYGYDIRNNGHFATAQIKISFRK